MRERAVQQNKYFQKSIEYPYKDKNKEVNTIRGQKAKLDIKL